MKKFKFTISGKPYEVEVQNIEGNLATVNVNGTEYKVEMEEQAAPVVAPVARPAAKPAATQSQSAAPKPAAAVGGAGYKMAAPLPGTIMQIFVKQGDTVSKGDKLLMYEAMKMENNLLAETAGTITAVNCRQGDNVLQGDVLIVIG
ncbi:MAG: biotin/lipoyl-binding protein [Bacteroidales bacterium]|nr:biotin/lipoyl-binding protein [Bacteroidales bacterium]